jgi:hypothetical protein
MGSAKFKFSLFFVSVFASFQLALAEPGGIRAGSEVRLERGTPVFELMDREGGIADIMDEDAKRRVEIVPFERIEELWEEFNPEVFEKLMPAFRKKEKGFEALVAELQGKKHNVATIVPAIAKILKDQDLVKDPGKIALTATRLAPVIMISSGSNTELPLGDSIRTFHYGYKPGNDNGRSEAPEVNRKRTKSGRSYVDTPNRRTHDPSDVYFLKETSALFKKMKDPGPFFEVMFQILTEGDDSGVEKLSPEAQTVLGDWFGIYIAEQRRHRMTGWKRMDWENALTELVILAPYTLMARQIRTKDGQVIEGDLVDYFGVGNDGSGLGGLAGIERRKYTRAISNIMAELHPEEHAALKRLIGARKGADLCSGGMKYLNNAKNQEAVKANAQELSAALVNYVRAMRDSASEIAARLAAG